MRNFGKRRKLLVEAVSMPIWAAAFQAADRTCRSREIRGSRSIILFRQESRAVYVYGFEKKNRANIKPDELEAFRELARVILGYTEIEMARHVEDGALLRVEAPAEDSNA